MTHMPRLALVSAVAAALILGVGAPAQLMRGHDSNAPVNFAADRIEVQDRADRVVVAGNVHVTQAGLALDAARMTVAYRDAGGVQIDRIDASGGVRVTRGADSARGDVAIYDLKAKIITLLGNVMLSQGANHLTGGRLVMDLNTGRSAVDGHSGPGAGGTSGAGVRNGRVSGTFTVPQRR